MKRCIIAGLVFLSTVFVYAQNEPKYEQMVGLSLNMHLINFYGALSDNNALLSAGAGVAYGVIHKDIGFSSIVTISFPIYNIFYGSMLIGSGICVDGFFGYGKAFYYHPPLAPDAEMENIVNLSGGLHMSVLSVFSGGVLQAYTAGPAINMYIGDANQKFRADMTFWFDPIAYCISSNENYFGWKKYQIGFSTVLGFRL